jgi:hypothetical protein
MRRVVGMACGLFFASCLPPVTHLGGSDYRLNCEDGMGVCRQSANRVCPLGYDIVESSTAPDGAGSLLVRCVQPKKKPSVEAIAASVELEETKPCPPAMPEGLECVRNFQCSGEGARCIDGKCVAATTTNWIDPPATAPGADAGAAPSGWHAAPDAGAPQR